MPELPDVEVFRRYFDRTSLHQRVEEIDVFDERIMGDVSPSVLRDALGGNAFTSTTRHGKYMFAGTDNDAWLVLHFGMTGYLRYLTSGEEFPTHTRVLFGFQSGNQLAYVCQRLLGRVDVTTDRDAFVREHELGPDALQLSLDDFKRVLQGRRGTMKSILTKQSVIAGLGNIYADEILFQSRIHPKRQVADLSESDIQTLYDQMPAVVNTAVDAEVDVDRMPDTFLLRYREVGAACPRCGTGIRSLKVSSRTTYYCPNCQPEP